jgi:hypothetical protein
VTRKKNIGYQTRIRVTDVVKRVNIINRLRNIIKALNIISIVFVIIGLCGVVYAIVDPAKKTATSNQSTTEVSGSTTVLHRDRELPVISESQQTIINDAEQVPLQKAFRGKDSVRMDTAISFMKLNLQMGRLKQTDTIQVRYGGYTKDVTNLFYGKDIIGIGRNPNVLSVRYEAGNLRINWPFIDHEKKTIGGIIDNVIFWNKRNIGKISIDNNGFEVLDENGQVVVSLIILIDHSIFVQGYFIMRPTGHILVINDFNSLVIGAPVTKERYIEVLKSLFVAPYFNFPEIINIGTGRSRHNPNWATSKKRERPA